MIQSPMYECIIKEGYEKGSVVWNKFNRKAASGELDY